MSLHNEDGRSGVQRELASHVGVDVTMIQENVAAVQDVKHIIVDMVGMPLYMAVFRNSCICKMCKC